MVDVLSDEILRNLILSSDLNVDGFIVELRSTYFKIDKNLILNFEKNR